MYGVNLLREGLDLPEVSLVAILDADKEGFLRSHRSLTQTAGRAARNVNGRVIFYADKITDSMQDTIDETNRRREKQIRYNEEHGITPTQIVKGHSSALSKQTSLGSIEPKAYIEPEYQSMVAESIEKYETEGSLETDIEKTRKAMMKAAKNLEFLEAAQLRDHLLMLEDLLKEKHKEKK